MCTNTYLPHVGGVARSVHTFAEAFRKLGHQVRVLCPAFEEVAANEQHIIRVPAVQKFNGSDFSVPFPVPLALAEELQQYAPHIVHSHHPFLLGDTALRVAAMCNVPLVFTHHTMYERYTHYVPGNMELLGKLVIDLATGYANLCDMVFAPSESIAAVLEERGVDTPIVTIPTGVDTARFAHGDKLSSRRKLGLSPTDFVVGHLGRLAAEKNLHFLAQSVQLFLKRTKRSRFVVFGSGPAGDEIAHYFRRKKLSSRVSFQGVVQGEELLRAYRAMDLFVFASKTETQGMVLAEAMAAGVPVVALDAPGAREIVQNGYNGYLVVSEDPARFSQAINRIFEAGREAREALSVNARETASHFSVETTSYDALMAYRSLLTKRTRPRETETSNWRVSLRLIESEWALWANRAEAIAGAFIKKETHSRFLFLREKLVRAFRWQSSRHRTKKRNLRGLVLIQIDGLSRDQFERALATGKMKFLRRILKRERYQLHTLYSGVPSTTPAVQGELFYGEKCAVPAFGFRDQRSNRIVNMLDPEPVLNIQQELSRRRRGLLEQGSSYANIFSGGANYATFCSISFGIGAWFRELNLRTTLAATFFYFRSIIRMLLLALLELFIAFIDCLNGTWHGFHFTQELKFIPARVIVTVILRELIQILVSLDISRGVPIIHLNLLGYDEHAHRRGPSSDFAHWTLKGIDRTIAKIFARAKRGGRNYDVWVYSDHGQEDALQFDDVMGRSIEQAIADAFREYIHLPVENVYHGKGIERQRVKLLRAPKRRHESYRPTAFDVERVQVVAFGPLGYIYLPDKLPPVEQEAIAALLVHRAKIPLVLIARSDRTVQAWNETGTYLLPRDGAKVLGVDHPFLDEVSADLATSCIHPNAGMFTISGWRIGRNPLTFSHENGAHGGPGAEETRAFALLPRVLRPAANYLRPFELREHALRFLNRYVERTVPQSTGSSEGEHEASKKRKIASR